MRPRSRSTAIQDATRGLASGLLVGIPVVFTVDSWWLGEQNEPLESASLIALAYILTFVAVYWIGFRRGLRHGWEYAADALEALAIAICALAIIFFALGQIEDRQDASIALGRIAVAAIPVSLGVAVANHLLPKEGSRTSPESGDASDQRLRQRRSEGRQPLYDIGASAAGALFLCLAIVPTDDLAAIATDVPLRFFPLIIGLSLLVSYLIVFAAGFSGQSHRHTSEGWFQEPLTETLVAYLTALAISFGVLRLFGRLDAESTVLASYVKTVLLAFPATMAAAAGRLSV